MIEIVKNSNLRSKDIDSFDFIVAFCSFEKRCLSFIKNISIDRVKQVVVFVNKDYSRESKENLKAFELLLGDKIIIKDINLFNPINITDSMIESINELCKGIKEPRMLVDITSFTHEALLIFIAISKQMWRNAKIEFAYSNAAIYASESDNLSEHWLSRGIQEVRSVLGYAGDIKPSRETVLIMMVGYECERALQVIDAIAPEELIITYNDASGSTDQTNGEANQVHANLLRDLAAYYQNLSQITVPSNNPFETANKLEEIVDAIEDWKNIIIAPMNNKLATVGAALVALKKPKIQLCYAPATYYNTTSYSVNGNMCYMFKLDLRNSNKIYK